MIALAQNAESQELRDALEELGQEAARLQTVIDTVPSFLWTSLPVIGSEPQQFRQADFNDASRKPLPTPVPVASRAC